MSTITTRSGKGSALTHAEVDANFNNLNTDKLESVGLSDITASLSGSDTTLVTGTAGTSGNLAQWNADGDVVDSSLATSDVVTGSSTDTFTNKTFDANANSLSNVETADIASGSKSGADATLITGTAGTNGNVATWNADGDIVDGGPIQNLTWTTHSSGATLSANTDNAYDADNGADTFTLPAAGTAGDRIILRIWKTGTPAAVTLNNSAAGKVWLGTSNGDFIELRDDGTTWQVASHYETINVRASLDTDESVAQGASEKLVNVSFDADPAGITDAANDEIDLPTFAGTVNVSLNVGINLVTATGTQPVPEMKVGGAYINDESASVLNSAQAARVGNLILNGLIVADGQDVEFWCTNGHSTGGALTVLGDAAGDESTMWVSARWLY